MQHFSLIQEKQTTVQQQVLVNFAMKQALHALQLPLLELSAWLATEIESNPVLEIDLVEEPFKESLDTIPRERHTVRSQSQEAFERRRKEHQENQLTATVSLFEHLVNQTRLVFTKQKDLELAELIIGHLNEKGFLDTPLGEIAPSVPLEYLQQILEVIQSFDPPGVGARTLQESLLLQLKLKRKENSKAARILAEHFNDLIHNRLPLISHKLHIPTQELASIIEKEIAPLDVNPGCKYSLSPATTILPDLLLLYVEGSWRIEVNTSHLPKFHVAPIYLQALQNASLGNEEHRYLRQKIIGGKWLHKMIRKRHQTLHGIGTYLLKKQIAFFSGDAATLAPLTTKEVAEELGMHESTIARAVANKYLACPQGLFPLRSLFKQGIETRSGAKISNHSLRKILAKAIHEENKQHPLSDEQLSAHFNTLGIPCARRTIAKYRSSLKISPAHKRKKWH
jgi:RNA polymerase sigma-54 factor